MKSPVRSHHFALGVFALSLLNMSVAFAGVGAGGGGDASESRVEEIRADILKWISEGGAEALNFPQGLNLESYRSAMTSVLAPHAVVIGFVTASQESKGPLKVSVDGQPKTCRGFVSKTDHLSHILCNVERFSATQPADQYRLIHHEYAGLAGVEQNLGASSDYEISQQITDYLVPETILRLSVKKGAHSSAEATYSPNSIELSFGCRGGYKEEVTEAQYGTATYTTWLYTLDGTASFNRPTSTDPYFVTLCQTKDNRGVPHDHAYTYDEGYTAYDQGQTQQAPQQPIPLCTSWQTDRAGTLKSAIAEVKKRITMQNEDCNVRFRGPVHGHEQSQ